MSTPNTKLMRQHRSVNTRTQEELYAARNEIQILTRHNEQL
jgi:hypothetical protein